MLFIRALLSVVVIGVGAESTSMLYIKVMKKIENFMILNKLPPTFKLRFSPSVWSNMNSSCYLYDLLNCQLRDQYVILDQAYLDILFYVL